MKKLAILLFASIWVASISANKVKFADAPNVCVFHKHHETNRITFQKNLKAMTDTLLKEVKSGFGQFHADVVEIKQILDQSLTTDNLKLIKNKLIKLRDNIENSMDISMGYTTSPVGTIQQIIDRINSALGQC